MRFILVFILGALVLAQAGCSKFRTYDGPEVTRIVIIKSDRKLYLFNQDDVLESFDIDLGFAPSAPKEVEGDGRTPEGRYFIDRKNPESAFHLSLGISYPNEDDMARAEEMGAEPGGDIFIHGARRPGDPRGPDWTAGCISVSNNEIEKIYSMVKVGTVIDIFP